MPRVETGATAGFDPKGQSLEGRRPTAGAAVGDLRHHRKALADRRPAVVGDAEGADQLVVELVVAETLQTDRAADDVRVLEGHGTTPLADGTTSGTGRRVTRRPLCPTPDLPCGMRVAAIQTTAGPERDANLEHAAGLVEQAAAHGARLVVLPEYFAVAGDADTLRRSAETLTGPTVTWAARLAARLRISLVAGTFPERAEGDPAGRVFNTSCLIGPNGEIEARYRKVHLFDVELEGATVRESAGIAPGSELCTSPLAPEGGATVPELGLSICYDLRFPELYRVLALHGATLVSVPAAFTAATGPHHWEVLLRARAIENQVYVVAAAQVGVLPRGMPRCHGHSMIVDPWGTVLAEQEQPEPGVVVADTDDATLERIRTQLPVLAHRRPDAYRLPDGS